MPKNGTPAKTHRPGDRLIIGCGFLGFRVAKRWLEHGAKVYALTRSQERAELLQAKGVTPIVGDILKPETLPQLPDVATVLCSVGHKHNNGETLQDFYIKGLRNVLDKLPPPARMLYVSSTSVYGQTSGEEVTEESATAPIEESGQVILEAEKMLRDWHPGAVILRFAGIYGPGRLLREDYLRTSKPMTTDPGLWLNLIHVDDGAEATIAAEQRAESGQTYNVSDDEPVRRGEFFQHLAGLLGTPPPRFNVQLKESMHPNRRIMNRKMRKELAVGLMFRNYQEGLADACGIAIA